MKSRRRKRRSSRRRRRSRKRKRRKLTGPPLSVSAAPPAPLLGSIASTPTSRRSPGRGKVTSIEMKVK